MDIASETGGTTLTFFFWKLTYCADLSGKDFIGNPPSHNPSKASHGLSQQSPVLSLHCALGQSESDSSIRTDYDRLEEHKQSSRVSRIEMTNFFEFSLITGSRRDDTSPKLHACGRLRVFINATISHIIKVTASAGVRSKHIGNDVVIATVIMKSCDAVITATQSGATNSKHTRKSNGVPKEIAHTHTHALGLVLPRQTIELLPLPR